IGTGGSTGAEGPIVHIGAAIASGVGQLFGFARHQMPIIIGCGSAAGISAIFNAPIGGVIFTIEVILQDFSIRAFTPLVVASVIANVTTRAIFAHVGDGSYQAIFAMPNQGPQAMQFINWMQVSIFALLGLLCGLIGVTLTKAMQAFEARFQKLARLGAFRPALGGALVGVLGIIFVLVFGRLLFGQPKPFNFADYPMPAFFGDGYGVIHRLLISDFYLRDPFSKLVLLLLFMCIGKIIATCLTLASGGSGGVIAPALFLGATAGGLLGVLLRQTGWFGDIHPELYALIGMGAGLAAVVHAPLASILILFELTQDYRVVVPAMLATVLATGTARLIFPDSIYTHSLRLRGIKFGSASDLSVLRRMTVEQVELVPATVVQVTDPAQRVLNLMMQLGTVTFIVVDEHGTYRGMVDSEEVNAALLQREALAYMIVGDLMRASVPLVKTTDDLAKVFDIFSHLEVGHLPVCVPSTPDKVIGLIGRSALMRTYQDAIAR
ncbi:MAG TPA: chloride channel protein, partial [Tepidisphaeraceae bacterium]|nr:chloride channel protein [Tepidisphaeraceae bacterium]